ncbi:MAG: hypothetical protein Q7J31_14145, partial [Syntrophales bacterium]|nr:hypothetical protein [Syntrophales bacterium]
MEEDSLFAEEVEPPGSPIGSQVLETLRTNVFLTPPDRPCSPVSLVKTSDRSDAFHENPRSRIFRKLFFPRTTYHEWRDWHWQLRNRITSADRLSEMIRLSLLERRAVEHGQSLPLAITPYYASLLDPDDAKQPLRRTVIPTIDEGMPCSGEREDPLEEERDSPVPGIVHRYPDRVLFLVTDFCSTYCR